MVPGLVSAVLIWPQLRVPKVWFGLFGLVFVGTSWWVASDLSHFVETRSSSESMGLRTVYLFLSETGKPLLQLMCGFLAAAFISWKFPGRDTRSLNPSLATEEAGSD
ncbi:MAG: hypothetical protein GY819_01385 [Planctomycetaceae bacterium]|nr:hypothetical protein [Planctomycetaceae bacterium]